ncbi:uncharacterized protein LOC144907776 [Branchiostoma floridae x Branchiostoma belcheri]
MSGVDELRSWAKANGLKPQTIEKLLSEDLDSIDSLKVIDKENVSELGLSFGQRHQLLQAVGDLRGKPPQTKAQRKDDSKLGPCPSNHGRARTRESTQHVSTPGAAKGLTWQPPFTFNTKAHGANIIIEYGNDVARSKNSASDGIVFSDRPIAVEEIVHLLIVFAKKKFVEGGKTMSVGFTNQEPNEISKKALPSHCHPNLSQRSGFWLNPIPEKFVRQGNVVSFWTTPKGHVLYAINGRHKGLLFSGVDTGSSLWATIEILGRALGVQIVGEETACVVRYRCFERNDRAKVITDVEVSEGIMKDEGIRNVTGATEKEMWQEFSAEGAEGLVTEVDDDGHVRVRLEKRMEKGLLGQQIKAINGVGFPRSVVSLVEQDDIRVGDIVRVVNDSGLMEMSEDTIIGFGHLIGSVVGKLGVVIKPMLYPESSFVVRVGQHNGVFRKTDLVVTENRGSTLRGPFEGLCQEGLHLFDKDVSRICVDCWKCTENGENCQMKMQMTHSPGRICGCKEGNSGCVACGRCYSCAKKTGQTTTTNVGRTLGLMNSLMELFSDVTEFQTSDSDQSENMSHGLAVGDHVRVNVTEKELEKLQFQHGGYIPDMKKCIGQVGRVKRLITLSQHDMVMVAFSDGSQWCFNPKAFEKVCFDGKVFKEGDIVRFSDDVEKLKTLQEGHGGWNDGMNLVAGKTGTVKKVLLDNDLLIAAIGTSFRWNPLAVEMSEDPEVKNKVTDRHGISIAVNDVVKVDVEPHQLDSLKHYPKGHLDSIGEEMNAPGVVREIDHDGDLLVHYSSGQRLYLRTELVSKQVEMDASEVDTTAVIEVDDLVLIDSDCDKVEAVQTENKMWHPKMKYTAGKVGQVRAVKPMGVFKVDVGGKTWTFAASLIVKADRSEMTKITGRQPTPSLETSAENMEVYAAFARGDRVQIGVDPQTLRNLQEGHGGYSTQMEQSIGSNGSIMYIDDDGDTWVNFPVYSAGFNTKALVKVPVPDEERDRLAVGDFVKICEDKHAVMTRQEGHGGWNEDMEMALGKVGRIDNIDRDGDIVVKAVGRKWIFNPDNLAHVSLQGDGQLPWNQADICAPGRHTWKTGKCMVCVTCEQCTDYGPLSPHNSNPLKRPGSVCDCGGSDVGCVDCGKCRSCTNECPDRGDRDVDLEIAAKMSSMKDRLDHLHDAFGGMTATFNLATDDTAEEVFGFGKGDVVRVKVTKEELEKLQTEKHGGYNPRQGEMVGATGRVVGFLTGSAIVAFPNAMHCLNPAALEKCAEKEGTKFSKGDFVRVCEDFDKLKQLQELPGRGGFTPDMEAVVGKTGKVTREALNGNIHVNMWNRTWCIHPAALSKISVPCKAEAPNGDVCEGAISPFQPEDVVQVVGSEETLRKQQSCHGGFTGEMAGIVGEHGIVRGVDLDGDVTVSFADGRRWRLNPLNLTKVDPKTVVPIDMRAEIVVRDLVRIDDDEDKAKRLQEGKGNIGWNINMQNTLGEVGRVVYISPFNDIFRVRIGGHAWLYRREMLKKVTLEDLELEYSKDDGTMAKRHYRTDLTRGDHVRIPESVDTVTLKEKQKGHGGYANGMEESRKEIGVVQSIDDDGDVHVLYPEGLRLCLHPEVIAKVDKTGDLLVGDLVKISSDEDKVKEEQKGHGEWVDDMKSSLDHTGRVVKILPSQDVRVKIKGRTWTYNRTVLLKIESPGLTEWGEASICATGKHDWSSGLCLVCTKCGECTEYGELCPAKGTRSNDPGRVCGCGKGSAGCDDCGWCKRCAGERKKLPDDDDSDSDSDSDIDIEKILSQHRSRIGLAEILQACTVQPIARFLDALTDSQQTKDEPSSKGVEIVELPKEEDRNKLFESEILPKIRNAVKGLEPKPDTAAIASVLNDLETDVMTPFKVYDRKSERILLGDTMSSGALDAAKQLTTYLNFLQAETHTDDKSRAQYACIQVIRNICQQASAISLQFCRQLGKTGMLSTLVSDLSLQPGYLPAKAFTYILTSAIAILRSCARVSDNHPYLREAKIEDRLRKLVHFNDPVIVCSATLILGHIIRDPGDECLRLTQQITSYMARCMRDSLDSRENDQEEKLDPGSFLSLDIAMGISALACRDDNRRSFLRNGFIPLLKRLITVGNDLEKVHAAKALYVLANSEKTQQGMSENEDLKKLLTKVARDDEDGEVKAAASDALTMIQYGPEGHYEYDVFVSFSSLDRYWVEYHLRPLLEKNMELSVCLYYRDFLPGDSIQDSVIRAIKNSRRVILVVTTHFIRSEWCKDEMRKALDKVMREGDCLIPILLDNCNIPDKLQDIVYLDCSANYGSLDEGMVEKLAKKLKPKRKR